MTVSSSASSITFQGNGVTTDWIFSFSVPDASSIKVYVTDEDGTVRQLTPAEYTVVLNFLQGTNPTPTGGKVIYTVGGVPIPVGWQITIDRDLPAVQNTSLTNQSIIYPPVIERALDYLTMLGQGDSLNFDRAIKVPIGDPLPADLPPQGQRINQQAFFDGMGNLTAGLPPAGGAIISAAMQPVVAAATISLARELLGLDPEPKLLTDSYVLTSDDNGRFLSAEGNKYYLITAADFTTYPTNFVVFINNNDTRAKLMNIFGYPGQFKLYPDQQVRINRGPNGWILTRAGRWAPTIPKNFYVDPNLGSDNIAISDGMATGAGAFQTIAKACSVVETDVDGDFTINLANGTYNITSNLLLNKRLPGGTAYKIVGNITTPSNVNIIVAASTIGITVSDGAVLFIHGVTFSSSGSASYAMWSFNAGTIVMGNCVFGAFVSGAHVVCWAANLNIDANYSIAAGGSAAYHIGCFYNGVTTFNKLNGPSFTVTLLGAVNFPSGYYLSQLNSTLVSLGITYVNAGFATNTPKGSAFYNGIINAGGAAIPGDLPASVGQGGLFF